MNRTVFIVATHTTGTGGFEWFYAESDALTFLAKEQNISVLLAPEKYKVNYVGPVKVPGTLGLDAITEWLDTDGVELWDNP